MAQMEPKKIEKKLSVFQMFDNYLQCWWGILFQKNWGEMVIYNFKKNKDLKNCLFWNQMNFIRLIWNSAKQLHAHVIMTSCLMSMGNFQMFISTGQKHSGQIEARLWISKNLKDSSWAMASSLFVPPILEVLFSDVLHPTKIQNKEILQHMIWEITVQNKRVGNQR